MIMETKDGPAMHHVVCCHCAAVNRIPAGKPVGAAKCGKCGAGLFEGKPIDISGSNLETQIKRSGIPVLLDVWAPWCGPCQAMAPAYEAAALALEPAFRVVKLNSDAEPEASARLGVRGIPTMILFNEGREKARASGAMSANQILAWARSNAGDQSAAKVR